MSRTVPTVEPTAARAGDTWQWRKSLSDFPAGGWTLTYTFFNGSAAFSITASADGVEHLVDEATSATAAFSAGWYDWIAQVSDGTDQHTVGRGRLRVLPDLSAAESYDGRSHARKMLDAIDAILEGRATNDQLDILRVGGAGGDGDVQSDPAHLLKLRQQYAAAVAAEDTAIAAANGQQGGRFVHTRFVG